MGDAKVPLWMAHKNVNERRKERMKEGKNEVPLDSGRKGDNLTDIFERLCSEGKVKRFDYGHKPCVYLLCRDGRVVYVGQTTFLGKRIAFHHSAKGGPKKFDTVYFTEVPNDIRLRIEKRLTNAFDPQYNIDNKSTHDGRIYPDTEQCEGLMAEVLGYIENGIGDMKTTICKGEEFELQTSTL